MAIYDDIASQGEMTVQLFSRAKAAFCVAIAVGFANPVTAQEDNATSSEAVSADVNADANVDPARLAIAEKTVDYLFPLGTYERMMRGTIDQIMDSILGSFGDLKPSDIIGEKAATQGEDGAQEQTVREALLERDPHLDERMRIMTRVMFDEMITLMAELEPTVRSSLAQIYAKKYDVQQLSEMNAFFATPTGTAFAKDYMLVFVEPEMIGAMTSLTPKLLSAMPDIMKKAEAATAHLPSSPINSDLFKAGDSGTEETEKRTLE